MATRMRWDKLATGRRFERGRRDDDRAGYAIGRGNEHLPTRSGYSDEEKKWMRDAEEIVAEYSGPDGWLKYLKREFQDCGTHAVTTPKMALAVFRKVKGVDPGCANVNRNARRQPTHTGQGCGRLQDAEKLVASFKGSDGWILFGQREQAAGKTFVTTPRMANKVFEIVAGVGS